MLFGIMLKYYFYKNHVDIKFQMGEIMRSVIALIFIFSVFGCATSEIRFIEPQTESSPTEKMVSKDFDTAWANMVSGLSREFFVINNIEKDSGIINVSYAAEDPSPFVDCGLAEVVVNRDVNVVDMSKENSFPWAYQDGIYTFVGRVENNPSVSGRVNIYMAESGNGQTSINVNARYVVTLIQTAFNNVGARINRNESTTTFETGSSGSFDNVVCTNTGELENRILSLVSE